MTDDENRAILAEIATETQRVMAEDADIDDLREMIFDLMERIS